MIITATDDEPLALQTLLTAVSEVFPEAQLHGFSSGEETLEFCKKHQCDIALLDVHMSVIDGISLAKLLKRMTPAINIIFTTAYTEYALEAFSLHASGYVLKPVTKEKIARELENLRHPLPLFAEHRVRIQCFGNFELFANDIPVKFKYNKTKELLAFLVDRKGAFCSNAEIIAVLWENAANMHRKSSYLRDLRADLLSTLKSIGAGDILLKKWGMMAVTLANVPCDYYSWLQGDIAAINAYRGEYLSQYSWGELTLSGIEMAVAQKIC